MKIVPLNIKGLRSPNKMMKVLLDLKRLHPDVIFLQKTHLKTDDFSRMNKLLVGHVFGSLAVEGKVGVVMLIGKLFPFSLVSQWLNDERHISHIVINHGGEDISLYNVYGLNDNNITFFRSLSSKVLCDTSRNIIVGADMNSAYSVDEDRKSGGSSKTPKPPRTRDKMISPLLALTGLRDSWRESYPEGREYTHYSHVHQS